MSVVEANLEKLELLNRLWERIKATSDIIRLAHETMKAEFDLENNYESPFDEAFNQETLIEKMEEKLINFVIRLMTKGLNVPVRTYDVYTRFKGNFDAVEVARYVEENYLNRADELAFEKILEQARRLLPYSLIHEEPGKIIEGILEKNRLVLNFYMDWSVSGTPYKLHDFTDATAALLKLAKIVLMDATPSKVRADEVYSKYWYSNSEGEVLEKKEFFGPITAVKVYKNGKVRFWFESEEAARKVAEVLVHGRKAIERGVQTCLAAIC